MSVQPLARAFRQIGWMTAVSRVLGFVRDVVFAALLGAGPTADAFLVALKLPNMFRRLTAEGALSNAFVPAFAKAQREDGDEAAMALAGGRVARMARGGMTGPLRPLLRSIGMGGTASPLGWSVAYGPIVAGLANAVVLATPACVDNLAAMVHGARTGCAGGPVPTVRQQGGAADGHGTHLQAANDLQRDER